MFGKLRAGHWLAILALLGGLWWWSGHVSPKAQQRTFKEVLVQLDSSTISAFTLVHAPFKGFPNIRFTRLNGNWQMVMGRDTAWADPEPVNDVLTAFNDMRVLRLVGPMRSVAQSYNLDTLNAEHLIVESPRMRYELRVGKHSGGDDHQTVVNPLGDTMAYAIAGLLGMSTNLPFSGWMPKYLVNGDPANWKRLTFQFPGGRSYAMEKRDGNWFIANVALDPVKIDRYLGSLARSRGQELTDPNDTLTAQLAYRLIVEDTTRNMPVVVVVAALQDRFIVRSSLNPMSIMPFDAKNEVPRMFRPPTAFLPDTAAPLRR
ncbi:MAG: DUF4340 domain-containing protein [Flavobacteriales bacterium]|nr:DUF4340 domain-containing protein [Flavobacteriales bacterium]